MIKEGERLRNSFNGRVYRVKAIRNQVVVLDAEGDASWIITEKGILGMFYKKIRTKVREHGPGFHLPLPSTRPEGA
jgi:hypothetical protein